MNSQDALLKVDLLEWFPEPREGNASVHWFPIWNVTKIKDRCVRQGTREEVKPALSGSFGLQEACVQLHRYCPSWVLPLGREVPSSRHGC